MEGSILLRGWSRCVKSETEGDTDSSGAEQRGFDMGFDMG